MIYPTQLALFPEIVRRVYDHDAIMRERAAAIKRIFLGRMEEIRAMNLPYVDNRPYRYTEPPDAQDAALFWGKKWCTMHGRADCWCTMCRIRPCPVWDYLLDEARRVNAP